MEHVGTNKVKPPLHNLESGACSANIIHVVRNPIKLINVLKYIKNYIK